MRRNPILRTIIMTYRIIYALLTILICFFTAKASPPLQFFSPQAMHSSPSPYGRGLCIDSSNNVWIGTNNDLLMYNGTDLVSVRSTMGELSMPNFDVMSITEGHDNVIWAGTRNGLVAIDRRTWSTKTINVNHPTNFTVQALLMSDADSTLWIGTMAGLSQLPAHADTVSSIDNLSHVSVTALQEDRYGKIWIGTWAHGIFRYDPHTKTLQNFPSLADLTNIASIAIDGHDRVWLGLWSDGLAVFDYPDKGDDKIAYRMFTQDTSRPDGLPDNFIYKVVTNPPTGYIWLGSGAGISVMDNPETDSFINYLPGSNGLSAVLRDSIGFNEVYNIECDNFGNAWLGTYGGGVECASSKRSLLTTTRTYPRHEQPNGSVCAIKGIAKDTKGRLWVGVGNKGISITEPDGTPTKAPELQPILNALIPIASISTTRSGKVWVGTYGTGLWIYDPQSSAPIKPLLWTDNSWFGSIIYDVLEDSNGITWMASHIGLSAIDAKGNKISFIDKELNGKKAEGHATVKITDDLNGNIWVATDNTGIIRIIPNTDNVELSRMDFYTIDNGKTTTNSFSSIFSDSYGWTWAASESMGLFLYNKERDEFECVHQRLGLPGRGVSSIEEDLNRNLWLATNAGLVRLKIDTDLDASTYSLTTAADGLQANVFNRNASFRDDDGRLYFGGNYGYNSFLPIETERAKAQVVPKITGLTINGESWHSMHKDARSKISAVAPEFAKEITLDHTQNSIVLSFSSIPTDNNHNIIYAYRLNGVDDDWNYTDSSNPHAQYRDLPRGHHTFLLKTSNNNGAWSEQTASMAINVRPAPWLSWWAICLYALLIAGTVYYVWLTAKRRLILKNEIIHKDRERERLEELTNARTHFFTTITHELLTPLAIISAAVDNRKQKFQPDPYSTIISDNSNRLIRLVQQILEFRKAETGNLKLKVSKGNINAFLKHCVESTQPFAEKKQLALTYTGCDNLNDTWFDPDKIDKIAYNLLSNAIKYTPAGGSISVTLEAVGPDGVKITVSDTGKGMTQEQMKNLFTFFYEGEYRRFKTIGTGIGLALTKNLVGLHHGTISVHSIPDEGTTFTVTIPCSKSAFSNDEIDNTALESASHADTSSHTTIPAPAPEEAVAEEGAAPTAELPSLLIVDDEEDLLYLVKSLLDRTYNIRTASSAEEALEILKSEDIDIIISDVMMGGMSGTEFCSRVKGNFDTCHIPVILLTAKTSAADKIEGYDCGAEAYISKPFDLGVLQSRIRNLLKAKTRNRHDFKEQFVFEAKTLDYKSEDEEFLKKAFDAIQRNLSNPDYTQEQFISELGISRSTAFRKLKSLTGMTYVDFARNVKMKEACRILKEKPDMRISEIAYALGFNNPKYFSSIFKKEFGLTPSEYIAQNT